MTTKQEKSDIHIVLRALAIYPAPIACPTSADMVNPNEIGITNTMLITEKTMIIAD
jgi:hypothetical protein